ncbi:acVLRF1 family peptidyl-tRNA hydrolase [Cryptosporangium sp. NPDC051539]|uniref:acVLRF1 family peptidyl-tRNA hydrolase n=1 Tax=Cryptosporangium sp. NPDC051539 TaxID=3363962 RepID=UPI0037B79123
MGRQPAAGGGRWVEIPPERLERWFAGFADRHGGIGGVERDPDLRFLSVLGVDGALAECHPAFPPLAGDGDPLPALVAHAARARRVGVLLVRLGGYAAGIFDGATLVASKVDSRLVHGRNKAGGQSAQRFARRREGQARQLTDAAAAVAERILLPEVKTLDAVVLGGDRAAVEAALAAPPLAPLRALAVDRFLTVPDPRLAVLQAAPDAFRATRIRVVDAGDRLTRG